MSKHVYKRKTKRKKMCEKDNLESFMNFCAFSSTHHIMSYYNVQCSRPFTRPTHSTARTFGRKEGKVLQQTNKISREKIVHGEMGWLEIGWFIEGILRDKL